MSTPTAARLLTRRQDLVAALEREGPESGHLIELAATDAVLRLLEAPADAQPGERAMVSDNGHNITLAIYGTERVAAIELAPLVALGLASELLDASRRHLARVPAGAPLPHQAAGCAGSSTSASVA